METYSSIIEDTKKLAEMLTGFHYDIPNTITTSEHTYQQSQSFHQQYNMNPHKLHTFRFWLYTHFKWYRQRCYHNLMKLTKAMGTYRNAFLFRGDQL